MDGETVGTLVKIIIFLPVVIILAYLTLKIGGGRLLGAGSGKLIRIVERVPLSNKTCLCVALINGKPYVISSTEEKIEILMELPGECFEKVEHGESSFKESLVSNINLLLKRKDRL